MDYDVAKAIERIEDELIYSIMRNLKRHRAEETKEGFNWEMWQVKQLQSLNKFKKDNLKYKPKFAKLNKQIEELLIDMATDGSLDQEKAILEAIKKGYKPPKRSSNKLDATFFKYNSKKLEALISETSKNMAKAETAILRMAHDKYRSIIFDAQMYAATGAGTYEKAVDMATRDFLSAGINCVEYSNGARHTLSNYARMAIRTASKRAYLQGEGEQRKEWGIHTVIVNKRGNPCPKCLPFVGKVLIDDVWSGGSKKDGDYMLMSSAIAAGLYHPNCKDSHTTYFEGLTTRDASFTKKEIETIKQDYLEEQKQLYAQNQAKKYRRLADNSLDEGNKQKYMAKADDWQEKLVRLKKDGSEGIIPIEEEILLQDTFGKKLDKFIESEKPYKDILKMRFNSGLSIAKQAFYKYVTGGYIETTKCIGSASYSRHTKKMGLNTYRDYIDVGRGPGSQFFHEHGHFIDDRAGNLSSSMEFSIALKEDFENYREKLNVKKNLTDREIDDLIEGELQVCSKHGISDIIDGITDGRIQGCATHTRGDPFYWHTQGSLERESFAHMYEACFDKQKSKYMFEYFPIAFSVFKRILKGAI